MMKSIKEVLASLLLFLAALFLTAIAPSLLLRYVYAGQQLLAEPKLLEYIPLGSFVIAILFFIYSLVGCLIRSRTIKQLMSNLELMGDVDVSTQLTEKEIAELESIVDDAIAQKKPAKKSTRKVARKTATKTTKSTRRKTKKS